MHERLWTHYTVNKCTHTAHKLGVWRLGGHYIEHSEPFGASSIMPSFTQNGSITITSCFLQCLLVVPTCLYSCYSIRIMVSWIQLRLTPIVVSSDLSSESEQPSNVPVVPSCSIAANSSSPAPSLLCTEPGRIEQSQEALLFYRPEVSNAGSKSM